MAIAFSDNNRLAFGESPLKCPDRVCAGVFPLQRNGRPLCQIFWVSLPTWTGYLAQASPFEASFASGFRKPTQRKPPAFMDPGLLSSDLLNKRGHKKTRNQGEMAKAGDAGALSPPKQAGLFGEPGLSAHVDPQSLPGYPPSIHFGCGDGDRSPAPWTQKETEASTFWILGLKWTNPRKHDHHKEKQVGEAGTGQVKSTTPFVGKSAPPK